CAATIQGSEPLAIESAIEMPYRLLLSPDSSGGWAHAIDSVASQSNSNRFELWNTRLGVREAGGINEAKVPPVFAVWSPALSTDPEKQLPYPPVDLPLGEEERRKIVSSDLLLEKLALSALGGWLKASSNLPDGVFQWSQIVSLGRDEYVWVAEKYW